MTLLMPCSMGTPALVLARALAIAVAAVGVPAKAMDQAAGSPVFRTVEKGSQSNVDAARQVVVRSAAEWAALWRTHNFDKPAPHVDFDTEIVVGVFMGSRPTGGYSVEVVALAEREGSLVVTYREASPRPGAMTTQVLTFPYHLVATARRSGEVRFERVP